VWQLWVRREENCLRAFIEEHIGEELPPETELLWLRLKTMWFNGRRYLRLFAGGRPSIVKRYHCRQHESLPNPRPTMEVLSKANADTLAKLENEAIQFIRQAVADHPSRTRARQTKTGMRCVTSFVHQARFYRGVARFSRSVGYLRSMPACLEAGRFSTFKVFEELSRPGGET